MVDYIEAFGFAAVSDGQLLFYLLNEEQSEEVGSTIRLIETNVKKSKRKKSSPAEGQLAFDLFG